jgi:hypothetical protein
VLWELGIASVVINLLALATPIFLMTVYNTVTGKSASVPLRPVVSSKSLSRIGYLEPGAAPISHSVLWLPP